MGDSILEVLALSELKYPIGSEPKPKVTINQYSTTTYLKTDSGILKAEELERIRRMFMGPMIKLAERGSKSCEFFRMSFQNS
ncbi:hypothetical protein Bca101_028788 [Brassica carinata]